MNKNQNYSTLATKEHFKILDGLRGVAAIAVVVYHFMEIAITDYSKNFIAHGYLAVDFFFCLSGFVIAYAYDSRIKKLGFLNFVKRRLIRLHPLVFISSLLGLLTFLFDPFSDLYAVYGFEKTTLLFLTSAFLIPYPEMPERYLNLFCLNAPAWSLFWEYLINLFYVLVLYKLSQKIIIGVILFAVALIGWVDFRSGNLGGGWGGPTFWDGGVRVLYSFVIGMLIFRANLRIKNKMGFAFISILLLLAFLAPFSDVYNRITEPILILFYFPVLVALGAGTTATKSFEKICQFLGDISFPLYMTHYPFVWIFFTYVAVVKPPFSVLWAVIPVSTCLLILVAYLIMRFVDAPLRNYLETKFFKS